MRIARTLFSFGLLFAGTFIHIPEATAQGTPQNKQEAVLIVEGVVREVFRSERQSQTDVVVELSVDDAKIGPQSRNRGRVIVPGQGEPVYVHLQELPGGLGHRQPPAERSRVRAYLYPRTQGGWVGSYPDWYEATSNEPAPASPNDPSPAAAGGAPVARGEAMPRDREQTALDTLGVSADVINAGGDRVVLRITAVKPDSPAAKSGFEPGDVIIGAAKTPITSLDDLGDLLRANRPVVPVVVVGKDQQQATVVNVDLGGGPAVANRPAPAPGSPMPPQTPRKPTGEIASLGATLESVQINGKPAWKVTVLTPDGPAQTAGFELGDLIVGIEGRVISDFESLNRILAQAGDQATLTVRDVRSGRSVPVKVALGRPAVVADAPVNRPNQTLGDGTLGITVESVDFQEIPTLRVSQIRRGGAGERAGLKVGDIVEAVNDTIVFNPEEFDSIVKQSRGSVELTLKKGSSRQKIQVPLGSR